MWPILEFHFLSSSLKVPSFFFSMALALALAVLATLWTFRSTQERWRVLILMFMATMGGITGGRFFHLLLETTSSTKTTSGFQGMTFYGALAGGLVAVAATLPFLISTQRRPLIWDFAAYMVTLSWLIMRVGCYFQGCCWGKLSGSAWAVRYANASSSMPYLGIPVHPVQLYEAGFAGLTLIALWGLPIKYPQIRGYLFPIFLWLYASARFFTEFFRGDTYRGTEALWIFSTSQVISLSILVFLVLIIALRRNIQFAVATFIASMVLSGCDLPQPPPSDLFSVNFADHQHIVLQSRKKQNLQPTKNLLFLATDEVLEAKIRDALTQSNANIHLPSLEDLAWWEMAPLAASRYDTVIRVLPGGARFQVLQSSLDELNSLQKPFDLIVLSHGFPNHLSSGNKGYFLSFREMKTWSDRYPNLDLVFLQACFGASLAPDFFRAGAKKVLAYSGLNINFVFVSLYFQYYRHLNADEAYRYTTMNLQWYAKNRLSLPMALSAIGIPLGSYLSQIEAPQYISSPVTPKEMGFDHKP